MTSVEALGRWMARPYPGRVQTDVERALSRCCARARERAEGSRRLMARAHARTQAQVRYARAVEIRAREQADRNANKWPVVHGLASAREGHTDDDAVRLVLAAARSLFDDCDSVSLTTVEQLGEDRQPYRTGAATGVARPVDEAQYRLGEGPCIDAVELDMVAVVRADNLAGSEARRSWPRLSRAAEELGVRSALSIAVPWTPLRIGVHAGGRSLGALNFYASEPHTFVQSEHHATLLGCWAGAITSGRDPAEILSMSD